MKKILKSMLLVSSIVLLASCTPSGAKNHFKNHLKDPDSYKESSSEKRVYKNEETGFSITIYRVEYRAKNGFGGYNTGVYYAAKENGVWKCSECSSIELYWNFAK